ncbi:MAG: helix-turn-helix transcriptional regulator [Winogradskyella arenosi]
MNRIKDVLVQKGLKQIWLSQELGKSYNMVLSYTNNKRQPSVETLYKIADILDISVKDLLIDNKIND